MIFNEYTLNELCNIGSSKRIYLSEYVSEGIPFYRGKEIIEKSNGKNISSELFISEERYEEIKNKFKVPKIGDILISAVGTLGKCWYVDEEKFYFKDGNLVWLNDFNIDIINPKFLYYKLTSKWFESIIDGICIGSTQKALTIEQLKKVTIKIPSIDIQNKVVNILDSINNKLKVNNEINNNLYELGNTIFKEWQSSCNETKTIGELSDNIIKYSKGEEQNVKLLNSSDVTEGIFIDAEIVPNIDLKGHFKKKFQKFDILYSEIRPRNKHYGYVLFDDYDTYIASTRLMVMRSNSMISSSLLYFSIMSSKVLEEFTLKTESRSGTFPQGNYEDMSKIVIPFSSKQEEITKQLDVILEKINSNYCENKTLEQLRDTLLPKLMNGEIDLDNIEI